MGEYSSSILDYTLPVRESLPRFDMGIATYNTLLQGHTILLLDVTPRI